MAGRAKAKARRPKKKTGRRPGRKSSRDTVLNAARSRFASYGYDATTIRGIAADAGVDPALVMQFYGSKEGLFAAILEDIGAIMQSASAAIAGPRTGIGERMTRAYLSLWEQSITGDKLRSLIRAAVGSPRATRMWHNQVQQDLTKSGLPGPARVTLMLAVSHLFGTAMVRHILKSPELVTLSFDDLVRRVSPAIEGYLNPSD